MDQGIARGSDLGGGNLQVVISKGPEVTEGRKG